MSIHDVLLAKCQLCSTDSLHIRVVFKQLHRKFKLLLTNLTLTTNDHPASPSDNDGFQQLLRVLNVKKELRSKRPLPCKHTRLFRMLQKSLNCNSPTLDYLCEITAAKVAERNYSLGLMEGQVKNAADRMNGQMPVIKQEEPIKIEPKFASIRTLPSEREIKEGGGFNVLPASQTSLQDLGGDYMPAFPFYCQFPFFYGKQ